MKQLSLLICLMALSIDSFAKDLNIEVRLPAAGIHLMMPKYFDSIKEVCGRLRSLNYTKGKITCSASGKDKTRSTVKIIVDETNPRKINLTTNYKGRDEFNAGWIIDKTKKDYKSDLAIVEKIITRYIMAIENKRIIEETMLTVAAKDESLIAITDDFQYIDTRNSAVLSFDEAKDMVSKDQDKLGNFWKASLNIAVVLGIGQAWYWSNQEFNAVDWEYEFDWKSYRQKLVTFEAVKFDSNHFDTNAMSHPLAGMFYFTGVRTLGYNFVESFLFALAGSSLWEYIGEFKEKVSLNDVIVTPQAGAVVGEVAFRLSEFLLTSDDSVIKKIFGMLVDPFGAVNRLLYGRFPKRSGNLDKYGFNADIFHEFKFTFGATLDKGNSYVKLTTALYDVEDYLQESEHIRTVKGGDVSIMEMEAMFGKEGIERIKALFEVTIAGIQKQNIVGKGKSKKGYSVLVGLQSGYDYQKTKYGKFTDNIGIANIVGGMVELHLFYKGFHLSTRSSINADFTQIKSIEIKDVREKIELEGTKSVLESKDYYFAFGITARNRTSIKYHNFSLNAALDYNYANSIEGMDREQESGHVVDDFDLVDHRFKVDTSVDYKFFQTFLVGLGYTYSSATGTAKDITASDEDHFFYGRFGFDF